PLAVVMGALGLAANATGRFFRQRCRDTMRAFGSPKMPRTVAAGRKPGNRYVSGRRMIFRIQKSCQVSTPLKRRKTTEKWLRGPHSSRVLTHTLGRRAFCFKRANVESLAGGYLDLIDCHFCLLPANVDLHSASEFKGHSRFLESAFGPVENRE